MRTGGADSDLSLAQVRAFVALAERGHFGRAAGDLHLSQQGLSKRVARLEQRTGALLTRIPHGVELTVRGERLLPAARRALDASDAMWTALAADE